ncbi:hypothetical protein A9R05_40765 (plasmid) [Burkholderia sp. KK1]|nr:hypothetical protein A9R05_40765 [Burkholderia sp. KK1]
MFDKGELWRRHQRDNGQIEAIDRLSRTNLARLRANLKRLSPLEHDFVTKFDKRPFYATHFTPAERDRSGETTLYSRKKLIEKGITFDLSHSQAADLADAANDDYVFFSLECGRTPKKARSRFGDVLYRFDLKSSRVGSRFEHAWLSLNDMVEPASNSLPRCVPGLPESDYQTVNKAVRVYNKPTYVFSGGSMMMGVALSIVELTRKLSPESQRKLLSALSDDDTDKTLNGLFRPELKLARFLITDDFEKHRNATSGAAAPSPPSPGASSTYTDILDAYHGGAHRGVDSDSSSNYSQESME